MPKKRGNNEGSITKRSDGRWMARIAVGRDPQTGQLKRVSFYGKTRQEAADQMARALSDLSRGSFVKPEKMTVGEWLDIWLNEYKRPGVRQKTYDCYEVLIRCHLKPALGHIPLKDLRPENLQWLYNEKAKAGLSARTIHLIHVVIHGALEQAIKNQLVLRNASVATVRPREAKKEIQPLSLDQVSQLLAVIREDRPYPAILLEFSTGLRRGELLALRWQDVDLQAGLLHVRQNLVRVSNQTGDRKTRIIFQEPKTPQSRRTIPLPEDILEELKRHKARQAQEKLLLGQAYQDHGLIFCQADGKPMSPMNFTRSFDRMLKRAGLPDIRFHDARHTFATLMLELGEHPKTVQTMLGHSNIAMTLDLYSHVSLELERRAAARLNEALQGKARLSMAK